MVTEYALAVQIPASSEPALEVVAQTALEVDTKAIALRAAMTTLAEEGRRLVPGGDLEVRATVYVGGHLKVYVNQGFVPPSEP